jgi:hypothetical protein
MQGRKNAGKVFGLAFIVPRLETEFAVPELTKNLVTGIGGAWRFYRADQTPPAMTDLPVAASYCVSWQTGCRNGWGNLSNVEGSIFVKYVP